MVKGAALVSLLTVSACGGPAISTVVGPPHTLIGEAAAPRVSLTLDVAVREVIVDLGPFDVPAMAGPDDHGMAHGAAANAGEHAHRHETVEHHTSEAGEGSSPSTHGAPSPLMPFQWPVDGWLQGFQVRVTDGAGRELPRHILHHLIGVNFDRRQLAYPVFERFFGIGTETADVALPSYLGVPMDAGQDLGLYASWHNDTGRDLDEVYVRIAMDYTPRSDLRNVQDVMPAYFDTDYVVGGDNMFDVPPGRSERSWEFTVPVSGGLLAASGHLHDYGRHVRLEDAETGEVLVRLESVSDEGGRLLGVETRFFRRWLGLRSAPLRLEAGHRYRIVGVYDNPSSETIVDGAMAHMVGIFAPDDMAEWPSLDPESDLVELDRRTLPPPLGDGHDGHEPR